MRLASKKLGILFVACIGLPAYLTVADITVCQAAPSKKAKQNADRKKQRAKKALPALILQRATTRKVAHPDVRDEKKKKRSPSKVTAKKQGSSKRSSSKRRGRTARRDLWPPITLEHANTKEKLSFRLYDRRGRVNKSALRKMRSFLRCHITGKKRSMHWRLIRSIYRIGRHFPGKTMLVYSGYRAQKVASLRTSNHVKGRAIDFTIKGVGNKTLRDYLMKSFKPCGVGYYPNVSFLHFDVRNKRSAFWVDYSGKGESANYASDPYAVLREERTKAKKSADGTAKTAAKTPLKKEQPANKTPQKALLTTVAPQPMPSTAPPDSTHVPDIPPLGKVKKQQPALKEHIRSPKEKSPPPDGSNIDPQELREAQHRNLSSAFRPLAEEKGQVAP